jgi:hypothetical protein
MHTRRCHFLTSFVHLLFDGIRGLDKRWYEAAWWWWRVGAAVRRVGWAVKVLSV